MIGARYNEIAEALFARRLHLAEPLRLPVEQDIAAEHNVARETVRRALKILEDRGAVVRRRGLGTYLQPLRAPLNSLKGESIGFVPPYWAGSTSSPFTSTVLDGVARWADTEQCHLAVLHADRIGDNADKWIADVRARNLAGLIWVQPQYLQVPLIERCAKHVPCVVLGRHYADRHLHHVTPDYDSAAQMVDDRLFSQGHQEYAVIIVDQLEAYSANWVTGIQAAHERRGQRFDTHRHLIDIKGFDRNKAAALIEDFYQPVHPEICAYFISTSSLLVPLLSDDRFRARVHEKKLSIIAMDYGLYPMAAYWLGHTIDHIACDWAEIGRRAMESLALLAAGHEVPEVIREDVRMVSGETVHPPVAGGPETAEKTP